MGYLKATFGDLYTTYPAKLATYLIKKFNIKGRILDLGSGRGEYTKVFEKYGEAYGIDNDPDSYGIKHDIDRGLPFPSESYDWIFCKHIIEHVKNSERMIEESYRVLKKGGKILITTGNWFYMYRVFFDDYQHTRAFTKRALEALILAKGFKIEYFDETFYQLPFSWYFPFLRGFCWFIRTFFPWPKNRGRDGNKLLKYSKEPTLLVVACK